MQGIYIAIELAVAVCLFLSKIACAGEMADTATRLPWGHERTSCSIAAAIKYGVPANILLAIAEKEAGKPDQWVKNTNNTYDVGPLQFNTSYLSDLARYGIAAKDVAVAGCYPHNLAAWRIRQHILHDKGDVWTKAANYYSRTVRLNLVYRADLMAKAAKWAAWLDENFADCQVVTRQQLCVNKRR